MKLRKGFVSNSSSSSFLCEVCGEDYSGMDAGLDEAEMFECEYGHVVCYDHIILGEDEDKYDIPDFPYEIDSKHCPICSFATLTDSMLARYLMKETGKELDEIKKEFLKKFKNYEEYLKYVK